MEEQLVSGGDGGSSQAQESLRRSTSLLERIRAQREREARAAAENSNAGNADVETSGEPVQIPNYAPIANDAVSGGVSSGFGGDSSNSFGFFSGYSINLRGSFGGDQNEATQGLLSEQPGITGDGYSMVAYFQMFVLDIYGFFRSLPILAQAFLVIFLIWVAWKLL